MDVHTKTIKSVRTEIIKGIVGISREKVFYGHIIQQFQKVYVKGRHPIDTAAVGRSPGDRFIKLYLNEDFFREMLDSSPDDGVKKMLGVLEHEILHIVFGHLFLKFSDRFRGNIACDCVVNCYIPKGRLQEFGVHPSHYDLEEGRSAMWYYRRLEGNPKLEKQRVMNILNSIMASHSMWGDLMDDKLAESFAKDIVRKAKDLCGGSYGDLHGDIVAHIEEILRPRRPKVNWYMMLRLFCATATESVLDYTMKRKSKRFGTRPGTRKHDFLDVAVIVDTSASIGDWQLASFFNEICWIHRNGARVTVYEADTRVCHSYRFNGRFKGVVHGRGGTNLEPALADVEGKHDVAIYFTDFEAPMVSRRYRIPVLWVLTQRWDREDCPYPWGSKYINLDIPRWTGRAA